MKKKNSFIETLIHAGRRAAAPSHGEKQTNQPLPPESPEQALTRQMPDMIYDDRFLLYVQPVVDLKDGSIVGGEVLSRLDHPELGLVFPDKFLPAIEDAGLCSRFDYYIFRKSCDLVRRLSAQGAQVMYLSCNFSRMTLSEKGIAERLSKITDECGVTHDHLAVEITEREQETDEEQFKQNIHQLKEAGFRIFVDDLGAGVTSVKDLCSYPVDVTKLDRSMLLATETEQGRIVFRGLRNLSVDLGYKVLCEGVETEEQHQFVLDTGCHYCQGYLFYRPVEEARFMELVGCKAQ